MGGEGDPMKIGGFWPRDWGRGFPALRAGAIVPMRIGSLRGGILSELKEYPLALPKKNCQGGLRNFPPDNPLETPKGRGLRPPSFGIPPPGVDGGDYGGRTDGGAGGHIGPPLRKVRGLWEPTGLFVAVVWRRGGTEPAPYTVAGVLWFS